MDELSRCSSQLSCMAKPCVANASRLLRYPRPTGIMPQKKEEGQSQGKPGHGGCLGAQDGDLPSRTPASSDMTAACSFLLQSGGTIWKRIAGEVHNEARESKLNKI